MRSGDHESNPHQPRPDKAAGEIKWQQQLAKWFEAACRLEVLSPKPGNVNPQHAFADATVEDFLKSAAAAAPWIAAASRQPLGISILQATQATRAVVSHNTNLGILLLTAPLAAVPEQQPLLEGIESVLGASSLDDSRDVYEAIRLANPGGLGKAAEQDISEPPSLSLMECMRLAADRDLIAAEYCNGFRRVLDLGLRWLCESVQVTAIPEQQVTWLALRLLADAEDSLIVRKCGWEIAGEARRLAQAVLSAGWPSERGVDHFRKLDSFLRTDGNRRNPGTTADFVAAILFAAMRDGLWGVAVGGSFRDNAVS
ncbi:MAG: hypothetical protein RLZZ458_2042 [Planctomycetota bacterium]